jgi:hypothetical protein
MLPPHKKTSDLGRLAVLDNMGIWEWKFAICPRPTRTNWAVQQPFGGIISSSSIFNHLRPYFLQAPLIQGYLLAYQLRGFKPRNLIGIMSPCKCEYLFLAKKVIVFFVLFLSYYHTSLFFLFFI